MSTPPRSTSSSLLAAWLCAVTGLGCPAAQVKPPEPSDCSRDAIEAMFQELKIHTGEQLRLQVDINQPGPYGEVGVYQNGPVIGRVVRGFGDLPEGTLLHGQLWMGPDVYDNKTKLPGIRGHYKLAILPDGRKYPVCIVLGDGTDGTYPMLDGSKPDAALLNREVEAIVVRRWP